MTFNHPQAWWLLALGIPIVAFHFYRGRIRRMAVPTLLFWDQVLVEEERRTALKKLRHYASLFLNLLALFLLTSAVAAPAVHRKARYAVILDGGASLGAREADGRARMEKALRQAHQFVTSRAFGDEVSFSGAPFTSDLESLSHRMTAPPPSRRGEVRRRILSALAAGEEVTAVLFTDRVPAGMESPMASGRLRVVRMGMPLANVGWISGLPVRRAGEKKIVFTLTLGCFAGTKVKRTAVFSFNGEELERREYDLAPGDRVSVEWVLDPSRFPGKKIDEGGLAEAALEPRDALDADDVARFVVPPLVPPPVVVFSAGRPDEFLMRALHVLREGGVLDQPYEAPPDRLAEICGKLGEGTVVVIDRVAVSALPSRGVFLIFGAPGKGPVVERPAITDWDREAPPNRLADYSGLALRRSRILDGPALIRAAEGPVATWSARGGRAVIEFGFALEESDLAMRPEFLKLLFNAVQWAAGGGTRAFRGEYAWGEPLEPERPLWIDHGELSVTTSERTAAVPVKNGRLVSTPEAGPGFVRIQGAGRTEWAAVNLFDPEESDMRGKDVRAPASVLPPPAAWHARIPYVVIAAAAVLVLLFAEWALYHRGVI